MGFANLQINSKTYLDIHTPELLAIVINAIAVSGCHDYQVSYGIDFDLPDFFNHGLDINIDMITTFGFMYGWIEPAWHDIVKEAIAHAHYAKTA